MVIISAFIIPITNSSIPLVEVNDIYTDEYDKANILKIHFQNQTFRNEQNVILPYRLDINRFNSHLCRIVFRRPEVESVLKPLVVDKASGTNGLSNCILRELSKEFRYLFAPFLISPYDQAQFLHSIKKLMFVLSQRRGKCPSTNFLTQF